MAMHKYVQVFLSTYAGIHKYVHVYVGLYGMHKYMLKYQTDSTTNLIILFLINWSVIEFMKLRL